MRLFKKSLSVDELISKLSSKIKEKARSSSKTFKYSKDSITNATISITEQNNGYGKPIISITIMGITKLDKT